jgi:flagellar biosynthesis protein FliP
MTDVIGLYLNPPQQAIVLCVDEKSQIQALDRTQPGLPIKKGRCGTMTHDHDQSLRTTVRQLRFLRSLSVLPFSLVLSASFLRASAVVRKNRSAYID